MSSMANTAGSAQILMPSSDLFEDMAFFEQLGFRLNQIYPADGPRVARMSGHGLAICLDIAAQVTPPTLQILDDTKAGEQLTAPNGTLVAFVPEKTNFPLAHTHHHFEVRKLRDSAPWVIGRAGMLYRDLIPDRLGGSIIASHIRIPQAGPVPDMVHYHTIGFQLIYCCHGWVKLVYEDQGPPFVLRAGDCVTQPPEIRHRVLESSENLEVIEIGVPAEHMTTIDHDMELPTPQLRPDREFGGQVFCLHRANEADWHPHESRGLHYRETGIESATRGKADVKVLKVADAENLSALSHQADIHFTFVLAGEMVLQAEGQAPEPLELGDAFVIPPGLTYQLKSPTADLSLLQVVLP